MAKRKLAVGQKPLTSFFKSEAKVDAVVEVSEDEPVKTKANGLMALLNGNRKRAPIVSEDKPAEGSTVGKAIPDERPGVAPKDILKRKTELKNDRPTKKQVVDDAIDPELFVIDVEEADDVVEDPQVQEQRRLDTERKIKDSIRGTVTSSRDLFRHFGPSTDKSGDPTPYKLHRNNAVSKLKTLDVRLPFREEMHVQPIDDVSVLPPAQCMLPLREPGKLDFSGKYVAPKRKTHTTEVKILKTLADNELHGMLWCDYYKPSTANAVLVDADVVGQVSQWFVDAFEKLKRRTTRNALFKQSSVEMEDFIVDDEVDEGELEEFVPLIIIHGGVGKNALIQAVLKDNDDAYCHEINTSSNRPKREILSSLLEISTSHLVHGKRKGCILFDDVDVLFNENDKFFWNCVERVLMVSRRPVVITCRNLNYIPWHLTHVAEDQRSVFEVQQVTHDKQYEYINKVASEMNVECDDMVLKIDDIRQSLMQLQMRVIDKPIVPEKVEQPLELDHLAKLADILSESDTWHAFSHINQHQEYDDMYILTDFRESSSLLRYPLMPYELDTKAQVQQLLPVLETREPNPIESHVDAVQSWFSTKKRQQTRTTRLSSLMKLGSFAETADDSRSWFGFNKNITTEILPYMRVLARADQAVIHYNRDFLVAKWKETRTISVEQLAKIHKDEMLLTKFSLRPDCVISGYNW